VYVSENPSVPAGVPASSFIDESSVADITSSASVLKVNRNGMSLPKNNKK
jgi:hypothetical protein